MASQIYQVGGVQVIDVAMYNSTGSTISAGYCVARDGTTASSYKQAPYCKLTSGSDDFYGVAMEDIPTAKNGRVRIQGIVATLVTGTIGENHAVMSMSAGCLTAHTADAAKPALIAGYLLTNGEGGEKCALLIQKAMASSTGPTL